MDKLTVYPSARKCLEQHIGCREAREVGRSRWALYWSEGGSELTLYQPDEGPQEAGSIDEALEWIGGDQPVRLNPGTIKYLESLPDSERGSILSAIQEG